MKLHCMHLVVIYHVDACECSLHLKSNQIFVKFYSNTKLRLKEEFMTISNILCKFKNIIALSLSLIIIITKRHTVAIVNFQINAIFLASFIYICEYVCEYSLRPNCETKVRVQECIHWPRLENNDLIVSMHLLLRSCYAFRTCTLFLTKHLRAFFLLLLFCIKFFNYLKARYRYHSRSVKCISNTFLSFTATL